MAKKALQTSKLNTKNRAVRSKAKPAPEKVTGVAEYFGDGEGSAAIICDCSHLGVYCFRFHIRGR